METATTTEVIILKGEISKQVGKKNIERCIGNYKGEHLIKAWWSMKMLSPDTHFELEQIIWDYMKNSKEMYFKKINSRSLNIKTTIGEYTRKNGSKTNAHYTENGVYYGSVEKLGNVPVFYEGNFKITQQRFKIDLNQLEQNSHITQIFVPVIKFKKPKVKPILIIEEDEDNIPISQIAEKRGIKISIPKTCNICLEIKIKKDYDDGYKCSTCNDGFVCHECIYDMCQNVPYTADETGYCNDYNLNCPICRKKFIRTI